MEFCHRLPELPPVPLEIVEDRSPSEGGFLRLVRQRLRAVLNESETSSPFDYDQVDRRAIDAVVLAAHFCMPDDGGKRKRWVVLRSALRPPVALRDQRRSPIVEPTSRHLWELPAGLVEATEQSIEGVREAARRELLEETGFEATADEVLALGESCFPCPGVIGERQFFFHVEVAPDQQRAPPLDGSVLETIGRVIAVPLETALHAAKNGQLADAKTELGLRRLAEIVE